MNAVTENTLWMKMKWDGFFIVETWPIKPLNVWRAENGMV
jgi:hypothetical protein